MNSYKWYEGTKDYIVSSHRNVVRGFIHQYSQRDILAEDLENLISFFLCDHIIIEQTEEIIFYCPITDSLNSILARIFGFNHCNVVEIHQSQHDLQVKTKIAHKYILTIFVLYCRHLHVRHKQNKLKLYDNMRHFKSIITPMIQRIQTVFTVMGIHPCLTSRLGQLKFLTLYYAIRVNSINCRQKKSFFKYIVNVYYVFDRFVRQLDSQIAAKRNAINRQILTSQPQPQSQSPKVINNNNCSFTVMEIQPNNQNNNQPTINNNNDSKTDVKQIQTITRSTMKRGKGYKYLCNYCNKRLGPKSNKAPVPYKCQFCDRTFKQHHGWKDHLRVHTCENPYLCKVCGKRFTVRHNLNVHLRVHTGERPYQCDICKKSYPQKSAYNSHIKKVHGIKVQRKPKGGGCDVKIII